MSSIVLTPINKCNNFNHLGFLEWIAVRFLLLSLIISSDGNQQLDSQLGMFIGQISGWFSLIFGDGLERSGTSVGRFSTYSGPSPTPWCHLAFPKILRVGIEDIEV